MANKRLHSIQFPGLSDNYTIPQTAEEVQYDGTTSDLEATNVQDAIDETITNLKNGAISVGHSESTASIDSDVGVDDQTPFSYQTSGGESDLTTGVQKFLKLVGCDIVSNQLVKELNSTNFNTTNGTVTFNNGVATYTANDASNWLNANDKTLPSVPNHIVLVAVDILTTAPLNSIRMYAYGGYVDSKNIASASWQKIVRVVTTDSAWGYDLTNNNSVRIIDARTSDWDAVQVKNFVSYDLTQMFGNNDVVNAIIGAGTSDEKYANLISFLGGQLPSDYDTGTLVPSKSAKLECSGYNLLEDELSVVGTSTTSVTKNLVHPIIASGKVLGIVATTNALVPFVELFSNTTNLGFVYLNETNSNGEKYGYMASAIQVGTPITSIKFYYDGSHGTSGSFTYSDIAVFNYWDGSKITYEPWNPKTYELPNRTMHGMLKVDGNGKIYADGDELLPNGTGSENYANVADMSSWDWVYTTYGGKSYFNYTPSDKAIGADLISDCPYSFAGNGLVEIFENGNMYSSAYNGTIYIYDTSISTVDALKAKLNGKSISYKLATPVAITGEQTFTATPHVDDFGTMMFQDENGVQIAGLQGNEIFYKANVAGFAESVYVNADGDPDNIALKTDVSTVDTKVDNNYLVIKNNIGGALRHQLADKLNIDFLNTDVIDISELPYIRTSSGLFQASQTTPQIKAVASNDDVAHILCASYKTIDANSSYGPLSPDASPNMICCFSTTKYLYFNNTSYTDATDFKNAMKGMLLAYEKAST